MVYNCLRTNSLAKPPQEVPQMAQIKCDRQAASALGGRCRNGAAENGRCTSVLTHKDGTAPRADAPDVVLVKPKLVGRALFAAMNTFPVVLRVAEERFAEAHELVATMAGRRFDKYRPGGDSGTPVFDQKKGLQAPDVSTLQTELAKAGFVLADVHCWKREQPGMDEGFLVLGYRRGGAPVSLTEQQKRFVVTSYNLVPWGEAHVWANIPEYWGEYKGARFKFLLIEEKDGILKIVATKPKMDTVWSIERAAFTSIMREVLHTVNLRGRVPTGVQKQALVYNDGLWGIGAS